MRKGGHGFDPEFFKSPGWFSSKYFLPSPGNYAPSWFNYGNGEGGCYSGCEIPARPVFQQLSDIVTEIDLDSEVVFLRLDRELLETVPFRVARLALDLWCLEVALSCGLVDAELACTIVDVEHTEEHVLLGSISLCRRGKGTSISLNELFYFFAAAIILLLIWDLFYFGPQCFLRPQLQILCCYIARYYVRK